MGTLYLDRKGLELRLDGAAIALYENGERARTLPIALLDRVVIRAETKLGSGVIGALSDAGAGLTVLAGRRGERVAHLLGRPHNDLRARLGQYAVLSDVAARSRWSARLVGDKLRAQARFLRCALAGRPDRRKPLTDALGTLDDLAAKAVPGHPVDVLRGFEGAGAAAYFAGYVTLFADSLGFTRRARRPPPDPVNASLSLAYTLLHSEAVRAAWGAGLDPLLGFYHAPAFGRESLASDLIEPLRPRVDAWVWEMFRERALRAESFSRDNGACLLGKAGRTDFYVAYDAFARPLSRLLRRQCRALAKGFAATAPFIDALAEDA